MPRKHTVEDFKEAVDQIRTVCPPPKGTKVSFKRVSQEDLGESLGDCEKYRSTFTVRVSRDISRDLMEWVLIHEMAHVYDWRPATPNDEPHGPTMGVYWAMVYQKFYGVK